MTQSTRTAHFRFWLWLIRVIGVIVPRRLRADWRQEWEAELRHREVLLADWDKLSWRRKPRFSAAQSRSVLGRLAVATEQIGG